MPNVLLAKKIHRWERVKKCASLEIIELNKTLAEALLMDFLRIDLVD